MAAAVVSPHGPSYSVGGILLFRSWHSAAPMLVGLVLVLGACGTPADEADLTGFSISSHDNGSTVATGSVELGGDAPPNAQIVQDISFGPDKRTTAGGDGSWVLTVDLEEGENDLKLRLGDDDETTKTIRIVYDPDFIAEADRDASVARATAAPNPTRTPRPTPGAEERACDSTGGTYSPITGRCIPNERRVATATTTPAPTASPAPTPTPEPTPARTPRPTAPPTPAPTPPPIAFGGGDKVVGVGVPPGTYRTRVPAGFCYWERTSGFGGTFDEILANGTGSGYFTVTIAATDVGFSSSGCGTWSADLSAVTNAAGPISDDGVYIVGTDIAPGTWQSTGSDSYGCYVARLAGFGGTFDQLIANDLVTEGGIVITIAPTDVGFETTGCGTWTKIN